ncbi:protein-L-isoaspartate O-methyltransferase [Roseibium sp. CAU 1637]|uniref:Protein-L-isoaspartate O-methyltransferase n=1 Tax=Roseibium limicola TaxID=2816037 RepID=A0A939EKY9_9HYPH|nr:protein-L-isoaspartate O-methyltransferase [Roseibium limicola]MBO0344590.1 protein-L-isoaspartate O-methyltransferase [Roseibium limicola]
MTDFAQSRRKMVDCQLRTNDVTDHRVLDAVEAVPRERFVPASKAAVAYIDREIAIDASGLRVLIKPHVMGKMVQLAAVRPDDVVLVIGAGSGYSTVVLSHLAASVVAVEEDEALARQASEAIVELGIENASVVEGKLSEGLASEGPYDVIFVDGAVEELPAPLMSQLKDGGRLVVVEGLGGAGTVQLYQKAGGKASGRFAFNASVGPLPGFDRPAEFQF